MTRRIALVSDAVLPWHKGGKELRYQELLKRVVAFDVDVTVYTMKWWDAPPPDDVGTRGRVRYRAISPLLPMYRGQRRSMLQAIIFALCCFRLLFESFDVIEADQMPYLQLFTLWAVAKIKRVPLVVSWHEVWGKEYWRDYLGPLGSVAAAIENLATRLPDAIIAGTAETASSLECLGVAPARILILNYAVDVDRIRQIQPAEDAPDILCVGRLLSHKRVDLVIEALALLRDAGRPLSLGVAGVGPEDANLRALVTQRDLGSLVTFYGSFDEQDDIWSLMRGARVLAFPSEREGFGLSVAECLAGGTPVVCVDAEGNYSRRLVDDGITGSVVSAGCAEALAERLDYWSRVGNTADLAAQFLTSHPDLDWNHAALSYSKFLTEVGHS